MCPIPRKTRSGRSPPRSGNCWNRPSAATASAPNGSLAPGRSWRSPGAPRSRRPADRRGFARRMASPNWCAASTSMVCWPWPAGTGAVPRRHMARPRRRGFWPSSSGPPTDNRTARRPGPWPPYNGRCGRRPMDCPPSAPGRSSGCCTKPGIPARTAAPGARPGSSNGNGRPESSKSTTPRRRKKGPHRASLPVRRRLGRARLV